MQFYLGNEIRINEASREMVRTWNSLKEPSASNLGLIAMPISATIATLLYFGWADVIPNFKKHVIFENFTFLKSIIGFAILIIFHEVIHLVCHPRYGATKVSIVGFIPKHFMFYAMYDGKWSCRRFLFCLLSPFFILSLLPLFAGKVGLQIPAWLAIVSIVNGACACGDLIGAYLLIRQVPLQASVQNLGWKTYWTVAENRSGNRVRSAPKATQSPESIL